MPGLEAEDGAAFCPVVVETDQGNGIIALACGPGSHRVARLVEQDGDAFADVFVGGILDLDPCFGVDACPEAGDDLAIYADPAVLDPFIGFAAGARGRAPVLRAIPRSG